MSKELEKLENMTMMKRVTDLEHIDRIIKYMLTLPFSYFQKDKARYKYLCDNLSIGFCINQDGLGNISLEDALMLIGYEPGCRRFDPPDSDEKNLSRKLNAAGDSYVFALLISSYSKKDTRIKEFTKIGLTAYTEYLWKKLTEEHRNKLLPAFAYRDILYNVDSFKHKAWEYMKRTPPKVYISTDDITLGDLITKATNACGRSWMLPLKSIDSYYSEVLESYEMLNGLFMDSIRMPLIRSDRERFQEIITKYNSRPLGDPVSIDYEICYEHGGITKQ